MDDPRALFADLCRRLDVTPDRRGEAHVICPFCGKPPMDAHGRPANHFSFSERGGKCLVCGESAGLWRLARLFGLREDREWVPPRSRRDPPQLRRGPRIDLNRLASRFEAHAETVERWRAYKPLPEAMIRAYRLGYGAYPAYTSKCPHDRLQVPLIAGGRVVGFRGRAAGCDCGKWLSPGGSRMILFNGERLGQGPGMGVAAGARRAAGRILYVVENPIDCILLERVLWDGVAVATLGVSMWQDAWTEAVARSGARRVIVAFDNDRPGNGGGERGRAAWLESHPRDIEPNGVRLVNRLRAAGVDACLYPWPENAPLKADVGDLLAEVA